MTTSDPTGMHDWHSDDYVQAWIESYRQRDDERRDALRRIAHLIPADPNQEIRVLDIGGGWGPVTSAVLESFPRARMVLHDFSEPMLEGARRRLTNYSDSVSYVRSDLMSPEWAVAIDGQFDAVVSAIAIHNVRFPDRIRAIYGEVFPLVAAGGCFINLDRVASSQLAGQANRRSQRMERRQRLYEETGQWQPLSEVASSQFGNQPRAHGEASQEDLNRIAEHEPATLANQLRWLVEAGFDEAECFARDSSGVLMGAFRS